MTTNYLDLEDLLAIAKEIQGGQLLLRDVGLLESAVARPRTTVFGEDAYPTLSLKAGALVASIVQNHALVDGNKRLGLVALLLFLALNGRRLVASDDQKYDLIVAIADGTLLDVQEIAAWLDAHVTQA